MKIYIIVSSLFTKFPFAPSIFSNQDAAEKTEEIYKSLFPLIDFEIQERSTEEFHPVTWVHL